MSDVLRTIIERLKGRRDMNITSAILHDANGRHDEYVINLDAVQCEARAEAYETAISDIRAVCVEELEKRKSVPHA